MRLAGGSRGFPASFPPPRRSLAAPPLAGAGVPARSGLETELSVRPPARPLGSGRGVGREGGSGEACVLEAGEEEGVGLWKQAWELARARVCPGKAWARQVSGVKEAAIRVRPVRCP